MRDRIIALARINENTALQMLDSFQLVDQMTDPLKGEVQALLQKLDEAIDAAQSPSVAGRLRAYLGE